MHAVCRPCNDVVPTPSRPQRFLHVFLNSFPPQLAVPNQTRALLRKPWRCHQRHCQKTPHHIGSRLGGAASEGSSVPTLCRSTAQCRWRPPGPRSFTKCCNKLWGTRFAAPQARWGTPCQCPRGQPRGFDPGYGQKILHVPKGSKKN